MKTDEELYRSFNPLWEDLDQRETLKGRPFLAHYTSIMALESIMAHEELWFSNPLYMNDREELRFGILEGARLFRLHEGVKTACVNPERYKVLLKEFENQLEKFINEHILDTYVFCFSEHDNTDTDGLLSMWRGYGKNGIGAAIIFDIAQLELNEGGEESSLIIMNKIYYASSDDRLQWINLKLDAFARILCMTGIPNDKLYLAVSTFFERLKAFAIFTKHKGFSEEREWRAVYRREHDRKGRLNSMLHYSINNNGIEPKLKFKVKPIDGVTLSPSLSLEKLVSKIIMGPSVSSPLALRAAERMLEKVGKSELATKLIASSTPYRTV